MRVRGGNGDRRTNARREADVVAGELFSAAKRFSEPFDCLTDQGKKRSAALSRCVPFGSRAFTESIEGFARRRLAAPAEGRLIACRPPVSAAVPVPVPVPI